MNKKWELKNQKIPQSHPELQDILLANRGLDSPNSIKEFLDPPPPQNLTLAQFGIKPKDLEKAIALIEKHKRANNRIAIYGDYDVDGICSTAILWETIYSTYKKVFPHIPHREIEGYGLSEIGIDLCIKEGAKLIITVDNGIVAHKQVEYCKKNSLDIIIVDHHEEGQTYPNADAIIHSKKTSAAGLAWAISTKLDKKLSENLLELVAIAVISDLIPLLGLNRSLVKYGLEKLAHTNRPGLKAIIEEAAINKKIGTYEVGFVIGPRLNAMGRLEHAIDSLRLLCTKDISKARKLAKLLSDTNRSRQDITLSSVTHAITFIEQKYISGLPKILVVHDSSYHQGIIGLIASKLVEKYHRPSIALSVGETVTKASARSIPGFDITEHIRESGAHLTAVGGHAMAAGFSLETTKLEIVTTSLINTIGNKVSDELLERVIKIDCKLLPEIINSRIFELLNSFAPFGLGNPEPVFSMENLNIDNARVIGKDGKHLKLILSGFDAIAFGMGDLYSSLSPLQNIDVAFNLVEDTFNGSSKLTLRIKDLKPHG